MDAISWQLLIEGAWTTLWISAIAIAFGVVIGLLMDEQDHGYALTGDALSQAAIAAANRSHMPYSKSPRRGTKSRRHSRRYSG